MPARDILFTNGSKREWDMESNSGLLRWLNVPFLYDAFQAAVGATALLRRLIQNHVWTEAVIQSSKSGAVRRQCYLGLPDVEYIALNINQECVAYTQRTYGARGTFLWANRNLVRGDLRFI